MKIVLSSKIGAVTYRSGDTIEFDDTWEDLQGTVHGSQGTGKAELTYETYRDTGFYLYFWRYGQDDLLNLVFQMPHSWNKKEIYPHMHVIPMGSGSGDAYFEYQYTWSNVGTEFKSNSAWITGSIIFSITGSDQYHQKIIPIRDSGFPHDDPKPSSLFFLRITRVGTDPRDTYDSAKDHGTANANIGIMYTDVHYQKYKNGTKTEWGPT